MCIRFRRWTFQHRNGIVESLRQLKSAAWNALSLLTPRRRSSHVARSFRWMKTVRLICTHDLQSLRNLIDRNYRRIHSVIRGNLVMSCRWLLNCDVSISWGECWPVAQWVHLPSKRGNRKWKRFVSLPMCFSFFFGSETNGIQIFR